MSRELRLIRRITLKLIPFPTTGFVSSVPFFGIIGVLYVLGVIGLFFSAWLTTSVLQLAALCLVAFSLFSCTAVFWTLPGRFFAGASAAAGIALINSVGNLGGYIGPFVTGALKEYTGNLASGLYFLSVVMVLGRLSQPAIIEPC